jgi:urease accessory protein
MALGSVAGVVGLDLPLTEVAIGLSAVALGLAVALRAKPPLWVAACIVAVFAVFHGYAHGKELPEAADAVGYGVGFVTATGLLHLLGILIGFTIRWPIGERLVRVGGAAITAVGMFFLWSLTGAAS